MKKYLARSILKLALELVCVPDAFLLCGSLVLFAVHVYAVVQLLPVHPEPLEGLFAVRFAQVDPSFHAIRLDELNFRYHFYQILLCLDSFLILNDRLQKGFEGLAGGKTLSGFGWTDSYHVAL
jgi:hypothetical protein